MTTNIGIFGGLCKRTACRVPNASYWNAATAAYYCASCADAINYWSMRDDGFNICVQGRGEPSFSDLLSEHQRSKA